MIHRFMYMLTKWSKMLAGNSVFHVDQNAGLYYSTTAVRGYYNDLRGKVSENTILDSAGVPINMKTSGEWIYFPISIFQYGLGAYDLYLETNEERFLACFRSALEWSVNNQAANGSWDTFGYVGSPELSAVSAMAQGEGASLLLRGYALTNELTYMECAKSAIDFMLRPIENGGTAAYKDGGIILEEYIGKGQSTVLNGWIFAAFGLYDYCLSTKDAGYRDLLNTTVHTMAEQLHLFDRGYWTNYNTKGTIASPFYHNLHIAQLYVMAELFGHEQFVYYHDKWISYRESSIKSKYAFMVKACQKLLNSNLKGALVK
ncbi:thioredoxin [Xylanibacillus composti]|uniref:D-glucuronyl C5-epimerase C-terminal domain-containing protein n=1 Tax=Xylanibacillus composti TaxID=1572762 RepID=A0A8J4M3Q9_9BACL|nr:D-glucuronyl C5-epimerase family protein [Xylanibacillus composti]MDT9724508.1 thioredoxin [Xylanibacillus composti]GIQ69771.1 hypothetical protein XYCOK13_25950 [Xylanibacillus composti]